MSHNWRLTDDEYEPPTRTTYVCANCGVRIYRHLSRAPNPDEKIRQSNSRGRDVSLTCEEVVISQIMES
jgi:hypothetical protein